MSKDLSYFMREQTDEIVTVPGPDTFIDKDGNVVNLEIKVLSAKRIQEINENYRSRIIATEKKGKPLVNNGEVVYKRNFDAQKATCHLIAEALVYPNLNDEKLMQFYKCVDVTEMPMLVFSKMGEYTHVATTVMKALGITDEFEDEDEEEIEEAKNS